MPSAPAALAVLLALATVAGVAAVAPVWSDPGALAPASRFTDGHLLGLALWGEAIARGELPAFTTDIVGWPEPSGLRPLLWPGALVSAVVGPVRALCVLYAITPAFNAACGWALGVALGRGVVGRFVLGVLLAFHPWVVETLANGQVEQAVFGGAALQLAAAIVALRRGSWAARPLPGAVTALVGWAAPHVALVGCLLVGAWAVFGRVEGDRRVEAGGVAGGGPPAPENRGRALARGLVRRGLVLAATAAGALAVQAYHGPAFGPGQHVFAPKGSADRPTFVVDVPEVATIRGLFVPPSGVRPAQSGGGAPVVHPSWLGGVLLVAAGAATVRRVKAALMPLAVAAGFAVLALGPTVWVGGVAFAMPWRLLGVVAPTIGASMSAYRMLMGAVIALAIASSALDPSRSLRERLWPRHRAHRYPPRGNPIRAPRRWRARSGFSGPVQRFAVPDERSAVPDPRFAGPFQRSAVPDPRSASRAVVWAGMLALAVLIEAAAASTRPLPLAAQAAPRDASVDALAGGDGPVLDLPLVGPQCPGAEGHYLLQAALAHRPVPLLLAKPRAAYGRLPGLLPTFAGAWSSASCADRVREALAELPFTAVVLHTHDPACSPPKRARACLDAALGPGTEEAGAVWWPVRSEP